MEKYGATVIASGVEDLPRSGSVCLRKFQYLKSQKTQGVCLRKGPEHCQNDLSRTVACLRRPGCAERLFLPGTIYTIYTTGLHKLRDVLIS